MCRSTPSRFDPESVLLRAIGVVPAVVEAASLLLIRTAPRLSDVPRGPTALLVHHANTGPMNADRSARAEIVTVRPRARSVVAKARQRRSGLWTGKRRTPLC